MVEQCTNIYNKSKIKN